MQVNCPMSSGSGTPFQVIGLLFEGRRLLVSVSAASCEGPGFLASALAAAGLGWHVFPCSPGSKRPALRESWLDIATTDPGQIRSWWAREAYNVGIACGQSSLVVIDLDVDASRELLCQAHGQRYPHGTYTVQTPSGGCHLYFTAPATPVRNSAGRLGPLIDIRG